MRDKREFILYNCIQYGLFISDFMPKKQSGIELGTMRCRPDAVQIKIEWYTS
jgi:hypothetical protein